MDKSDSADMPGAARGEAPFDAAYRKAVAEYELPETDDAEIMVEDAGSFFFTEGWFAGIQSVRAKPSRTNDDDDADERLFP